MARLRALAAQGVPEVKGLRSTVWKLCLGYLPVVKAARARHLDRKRAEYEHFIKEFGRSHASSPTPLGSAPLPASPDTLSRSSLPHGDHPLSAAPDSQWRQRFQDEEMLAQIDRDVLRTHPDLHFFSGEGEAATQHRRAMSRALFIYAKLNPGIKYVQGMNELLAPLYYVFYTGAADEEERGRAEADAFFCFMELVSGCRDHFCQQLDDSAAGIKATLARLADRLRALDAELAEHLLDRNGVAPHYFAFRWITLMLTQEFPFPDSLRLWDGLLAGGSRGGEDLLRFCLAMLVIVRQDILQGDFSANMKLLQHYPPMDVARILEQAQALEAGEQLS